MYVISDVIPLNIINEKEILINCSFLYPWEILSCWRFSWKGLWVLVSGCSSQKVWWYAIHIIIHTYYFKVIKFVPICWHINGIPYPKIYSLCQKIRTFNCEVFRGPPGGGGPKIIIVDYVTPIYIIDHVNFWPPSPRGGARKNSQLNVRFFWHRLYTTAVYLANPVLCFRFWKNTCLVSTPSSFSLWRYPSQLYILGSRESL